MKSLCFVLLCFLFFFCLGFQARTELGLDDRLTLEGSMVLLDRVSGADAGLFKITDIPGFTVSYVHLKVKRKDEECSSSWKKGHLMSSVYLLFLKRHFPYPFSTDTDDPHCVCFNILKFQSFHPPALNFFTTVQLNNAHGDQEMSLW